MTRAAARQPRQTLGKDTRQRILAAARTLFAEFGYAGTSVRMIARSLQITDPAIHYHFRTKQDIFEALLEAPDSGELPLDSTEPSREALLDQLMYLFGWWTARPELVQMLLREQLAGDPASLKFMAVASQSWESNVAVPLATIYGPKAAELSETLYELLAGIFWDAILAFGPTVREVVHQTYFLARVRAILELTLPAEAGVPG